MKKILFSLAALFITAISIAQSADSVYLFAYFKNNGQDGLHLAYSTDGYDWTPLRNDSTFLKPLVAEDRLMRDPCIIRGADKQFHMVWTVSWNDRGIGYAHSADLLHWSEQQFIPVMAQEPAARNCWAPEITWDAAKKEYMIYWATTIPGRFAVGDTAGDDKYNHRLYYTLTKDFKTYSPAKLLFDPGFNIIDATIQPLGRQYLMFLKDETKKPAQKNIRTAYSPSITGPYASVSAPITGGYWAEGPTAIKIGRDWIVYFDKYTQHTYGAVRSNDLKNWTDVSDKLHFPKGARHGTVLTISGKELDALKSH
jgi:beta-xylosidase